MAGIARREAGVPTKAICVRLPFEVISRIEEFQRKKMLTLSFAVEHLLNTGLDDFDRNPESEVTTDEQEDRTESSTQTEAEPEEAGQHD
jgi:hypothetical protein